MCSSIEDAVPPASHPGYNLCERQRSVLIVVMAESTEGSPPAPQPDIDNGLAGRPCHIETETPRPGGICFQSLMGPYCIWRPVRGFVSEMMFHIFFCIASLKQLNADLMPLMQPRQEMH